MSRQKTAQFFDDENDDNIYVDDTEASFDGFYDDDGLTVAFEEVDLSEAKDKSKDKKESKEEDGDNKKEEEIVVLEFDNASPLSFVMPSIPGALDDSEIEVPIEVEEEHEEPTAVDVWDWQHGGHGGFIPWAEGIVNMTPQHSGHDVSGLERAMAWINKLIKEFPKAMSTDFKGEIDVNHCETMRDGLYDAMGKMQDRLDRILTLKGRKKKADGEFGMVKEAQKSTRITGVSLNVPLFISGIARTLINGTVSAGHSMEDMYDDLNKKYGFTDREEFEIQLLLADMGYVMRQDRGRIGEQLEDSRSDNFDYAANYSA